ncbi:MAG: hypothetical protein HKN63_03610 [Rhodobacteraceae bacterium]|nr:hypothetical protein [Paracoccaceae bacterium]
MIGDEDETPVDIALERRKVDEKVLGILREEASREIEARRKETPEALETQPDLGLGASAAIANLIAEESKATEDGASHPARLRGEPQQAETVREGSRRDLLPDIDEINSTLTSTSDRPSDETPEEVFERVTRHRSGFRFGFSLILVVCATLIGVYSFADTIANNVPSLRPALAGYVDWANSVRLWFDGLIAKGVEALSRMIVSISGSN